MIPCRPNPRALSSWINPIVTRDNHREAFNTCLRQLMMKGEVEIIEEVWSELEPGVSSQSSFKFNLTCTALGENDLFVVALHLYFCKTAENAGELICLLVAFRWSSWHSLWPPPKIKSGPVQISGLPLPLVWGPYWYWQVGGWPSTERLSFFFISTVFHETC